MEKLAIRSVWYEFLEGEAPLDPLDANGDAVITLTDGSRWSALLMTYRNVETLRRKNQDTGECLSGQYFCAPGLILVSELTRETADRVLRAMLEAGDIPACCQRLD